MLIFPKVEKQICIEAKPPLGISYLASSLEPHHKVRIEDVWSSQISNEELMRRVDKFKPDICGFTILTPYIDSAQHLGEAIKNKFEIPIIVGGSHPSALPERTLHEFPAFDIVVRGEGEETIKELVRVLENGKNLSQVKGITYRDDGRIRSNPLRPFIADLDSIPFPAWHLLDMDSYYNISKKLIGIEGNGFSIFTSRGCPGKCTFCDARNLWGQKYRYRSPTNVVDEIEMLYEKYGVQYIFFWDDTFIVNKKRSMEISKQIIERNIDITFDCLGRVNFVDSEVLSWLKKAGGRKIGYGIESSSQKTLDYIKKGITIEQAKRAIDITNKVGLESNAYWMMGFPHETKEDIRDSVEFNKSLPLTYHDTFSMLTPYPGTQIYDEMKEKGLILNENWSEWFSRRVKVKPRIKTEYIDGEELFRMHERINEEIKLFNYKKKLKYLLLRPHLMVSDFLRTPEKYWNAIKRVWNYALIKELED